MCCLQQIRKCHELRYNALTLLKLNVDNSNDNGRKGLKYYKSLLIHIMFLNATKVSDYYYKKYYNPTDSG